MLRNSTCLSLTFAMMAFGLTGRGWADDPAAPERPVGTSGPPTVVTGAGGGAIGDPPRTVGTSVPPGDRLGAAASESITVPLGGPDEASTRVGPEGPQSAEALTAPPPGNAGMPTGTDEIGPPDGLTLDQAISMVLHNNYDLRAKFYEISQADADILTAGLRANPVFFADAQLVPYGKYGRDRPGGQTQYDVNISYPLDLSGKRQARKLYATRAKRTIEAQYQNAVRMTIDQLYVVFLNVLAAQQAVDYARVATEGLDKLHGVTNQLYRRDQATVADVKRIQVALNTSQVGLDDAREALRKSKLQLAELLTVPAEQVDTLEPRGTVREQGPPPPPVEELERMALALRPDVVAFRLGIRSAEANVRLQRANRLSDVYVLYQPYTLQDNTPFGLKSPISWALGVTVPLPVYNRNQGNIARAKLNVTQTQLELARIERQVITEVRDAVYEYQVTGRMIERIRDELEPSARSVRDTTYKLYTGGEKNQVDYLLAQREYQDVAKQYLDTLIRHRRSMLSLNTVVGQRVLP